MTPVPRPAADEKPREAHLRRVRITATSRRVQRAGGETMKLKGSIHGRPAQTA